MTCKILPIFSEFKCVTSDCRPWNDTADIGYCPSCSLVQRPRDSRWKRNCDDIYKSYDLYRESSHNEQLSIDDRNLFHSSRSKIVLDKFKETYPLDPKNGWMDFGCGGGHLLQNCTEMFSGIPFVGIDQSSSNREKIEAITKTTYYDDVSKVKGSFDVISLFHVLEHLADPCKTLRSLISFSNKNGLFLIQVPDHTFNPFDLLIFDHGTFFNNKTLEELLRRVGLEVLGMHKNWINKEITCVCRNTPMLKEEFIWDAAELNRVDDVLLRQRNYLYSIREEALEKSETKKVKIFGSSIGACWLASEIGIESVECFLDQDETRWGSELLGKEIRKATTDDLRSAIFPLDQGTKQRVIRSLNNNQ